MNLSTLRADQRFGQEQAGARGSRLLLMVWKWCRIPSEIARLPCWRQAHCWRAWGETRARASRDRAKGRDYTPAWAPDPPSTTERKNSLLISPSCAAGGHALCAAGRSLVSFSSCAALRFPLHVLPRASYMYDAALQQVLAPGLSDSVGESQGNSAAALEASVRSCEASCDTPCPEGLNCQPCGEGATRRCHICADGTFSPIGSEECSPCEVPRHRASRTVTCLHPRRQAKPRVLAVVTVGNVQLEASPKQAVASAQHAPRVGFLPQPAPASAAHALRAPPRAPPRVVHRHRCPPPM